MKREKIELNRKFTKKLKSMYGIIFKNENEKLNIKMKWSAKKMVLIFYLRLKQFKKMKKTLKKNEIKNL